MQVQKSSKVTSLVENVDLEVVVVRDKNLSQNVVRYSPRMKALVVWLSFINFQQTSVFINNHNSVFIAIYDPDVAINVFGNGPNTAVKGNCIIIIHVLNNL